MNIGLVYDLRTDYLAAGYGEEETAEFDRPDTIDALEHAIQANGHTTRRIGHVRHLAARLVAGERWDLVFNIAEGLCGFGREAQVPALLDAYEIPYTFSDPLISALTLHKGLTKSVLRDQGVATTDFTLVSSPSEAASVKLAFPLFVKPVAEGTAKGITGRSRVTNRQELETQCRRVIEEFHQPALVEPFLSGREFTTGIIGTGHDAEAIGTMEVILRDKAETHAYTYVNKEQCEELVDYSLADAAMAEACAQLSLATWQVLGCRDAGRVDLRADATGRLLVMEVNPLPGLHPQHSDLPILATAVGIPYVELIGRILRSAQARCMQGQKPRTCVEPRE